MFAKGTYQWILIAFTLFIISLFFLYYNNSELTGLKSTERTFAVYFFGILTTLFLILLVFFIFFFRDPDRIPPESGIPAAADGVVKDIKSEKINGKSYNRIVTFMNVHNVHVNRIPLDGKIISIERSKGSFKPAYSAESSENTQVETTLKSEIGIVKIVQIAGIFARRIIVYIKESENVKRGDRLGMIRFGSRVDLILPSNKTKILVHPEDKVTANQSIVAELIK